MLLFAVNDNRTVGMLDITVNSLFDLVIIPLGNIFIVVPDENVALTES